MSDRPTSRLAPSFLPATAVLEMTYRCNHSCTFCSCPWYAKGFDERPETSVADWQRIIDRLCQMGCCNLAFTGGEPLLKEGIEQIIEFAASRTVESIETEEGRLVAKNVAPKLYLLSNGNAMRTEILDLCKRHDINLSMSLPGLSTFEEHTRGGVWAQHVLDWFGRARDMGVRTTVGVTVTRKNIGELFETISEALLAGADSLLMNRFLPGGRGLKYAEELTLGLDQIHEMLDIGEEVLRIADRKGSVGTEFPKCLIDQTRYEHLTVGTRCSAALGFFVVGPSGHIRVCNHSPVRLHHFDDLMNIPEHPYWRRFTRKAYLPEQCGACPELIRCDGGCREAAHLCGGEVCSPDPLMAPGHC